MADAAKTIFLSYRREVSWATAHLVRDKLVPHGFDVFLDVHGIDRGEFERVILREIERREHFLVLLEPRSLDRIADDGDWLRREIAHALAHRRNIVPVTANGVRMPRAAELPADIALFSGYNAISLPHEYVDAAVERLRERFLRAPDPVPSAELPAPVWRRPSRGPASTLSAPTLSQSRTVDSPLVAGLYWSRVDGAYGYELEQAATSDFGRGRRTSVSGRTYHDVLRSSFDNGRFFRVRAVAFVDFSRGPWSNTIEAF